MSSTSPQRKKAWAVKQNSRLVQVFSALITQYLNSYYFDKGRFSKHLQSNELLELLYSVENNMDVTALLAHEAGVWSVAVKQAILLYSDSEMSAFATTSGDSWKRSAYHYGTLALDLELRLQDKTTHAENVMSVPRHDFLT